MSTPEKTIENPAAAPTSGTERLLVLDVLRGFALFGVLVVNLPFAAMPMARATQPFIDAAASLFTPEVFFWTLNKALAETKFVSLFSLLFGIGLVLQISRAEARGGGTGFYLRRLAILGAIGLGHGLLLWQGDILFPYAMAGFVLYLLRRQPPERLILIALPLLAIGILLSSGIAFLDDGGSSGEEAAELAAIFGIEGTWEEIERQAWTAGPLSLTLTLRAVEYLGWLVISSVISFNWHVMALFCLGAAIMKRGWLDAGYLPQHRRVAAIGLGAGLALEAIAITLWLGQGFDPGLSNALATLAHEVGSLILAAGYLGAVVAIVHSQSLSRAYAPLAAVGRTALTSYLGQSLAFNLLFPWFGLGLWSQLARGELLLAAVVIYAGQAVLAVFWLHFFAMGPCEWLWRWATYGKRPPWRSRLRKP